MGAIPAKTPPKPKGMSDAEYRRLLLEHRAYLSKHCGRLDKNHDTIPVGSLKHAFSESTQHKPWPLFVAFVLFPFQLMRDEPRYHTSFGHWIRGVYWVVNHRFRIIPQAGWLPVEAAWRRGEIEYISLSMSPSLLEGDPSFNSIGKINEGPFR